MAIISMVPWMFTGGVASKCGTPSASLPLHTALKSISFNGVSKRSSGLLRSSFLAPSSSLSSSFSGLSLELDLASNVGVSGGRCQRLVVRAGKAALCQTKRNRSRKSLARTHGFRVRMRTTSGRAILKRRRDKGRKVLCTKTNPSSGKRS